MTYSSWFHLKPPKPPALLALMICIAIAIAGLPITRNYAHWYVETVRTLQQPSTEVIEESTNETENLSSDRRRLLIAKELAAEDNLVAAIALAKRIESEALRPEAQQLIKAWSQQILQQAIVMYNSPICELEAAIALLNTIPGSSALHPTGQALVKQWRQEKTENQRSFDAATVALAYDHTQKAREHAQTISSHPAWIDQRQQLISEIIEKEQSFNRLLEKARQALEEKNPSMAIRCVEELPNLEPWYLKKTDIIKQAYSLQEQPTWVPVSVQIAIEIGVALTMNLLIRYWKKDK